MNEQTVTVNEYPTDVHLKEIDNKKIFIVGTAHISKSSADLVRDIIEKEKPDTVCVELDQQRYRALSEKKKWESLDLREIIKQKQLSTLLINLLLGSYQKKLGKKLGVNPGVELLEAANTAKENNIPIALCDRDVRITLRRAWNSMSFWEKIKFMTSGLAGIFDKQELSEEKLIEIRQKDVLSEMMKELGNAMPILKKVLIDERDVYLSAKIREAEGEKIVAVVGAGHVTGILEQLDNKEKVDLKIIEEIPPMSKVFKFIGWGIPLLILGSILYIGYSKGLAAAGDNALIWILANGIPCAIGSLIAMAHPVTIIASFIAAPFTSLTPVIGAGYVAAFVQAYFQPPVVKEFQSAVDDASKVKAWWSNKLLRVFLVFIFAGLGSVVGTYVGAYEIFKNLF
jgi:pheromone shutdown-related protein TraB